ncbi:MAG: hypothetical protein HYY06_31435 [Deltaproteobacteria bacterium]|nr:hypothetical protein [Deltaproteobacteria bacterium]
MQGILGGRIRVMAGPRTRPPTILIPEASSPAVSLAAAAGRASVEIQGKTRVFDTETGREVIALELRSASLSPDGTWAAGLSDKGVSLVRLDDLRSLRLVISSAPGSTVSTLWNEPVWARDASAFAVPVGSEESPCVTHLAVVDIDRSNVTFVPSSTEAAIE